MRILYIRNQLYTPYLSCTSLVRCCVPAIISAFRFTLTWYIIYLSTQWFDRCVLCGFSCATWRAHRRRRCRCYCCCFHCWSVVFWWYKLLFKWFFGQISKLGKWYNWSMGCGCHNNFNLCIADYTIGIDYRNRMCFPLLFRFVCTLYTVQSHCTDTYSSEVTLTLYYLTFQQNNCR